MHNPLRAVLTAALALSLVTAAIAQPKRTGKRWLDMDYGPYKATTIEAPKPAGNFAYKGIAIRLGGPNNATVCFDTDTLRYSAGWTAGWLNLNGVVYDGKHWAYPSTDGPITFSNGVGPGWGKPGDSTPKAFDDPRFRGNDDKPYGPMPRGWAHWKGLYVHGDKVVLSYTVGDRPVLETPGVLNVDGQTIFTRTLNIGPSSQPMHLQVAAEAGAPFTVAPIDRAANRGTKFAVREHIAVLGRLALPQQQAKPEPKQKVVKRGLIAHWRFDEDQLGDGNVDPLSLPLDVTAKVYHTIDGVTGQAAFLSGAPFVVKDSAKVKLGVNDHTIAAWIKTTHNGTILAKAPAKGKWVPQGRTFFIRGGRLAFDVGWVGQVQSKNRVADGKWHHVAVSFNKATKQYKLYIDGRADGEKKLNVEDEVTSHVVKIGRTSDNFPGKDNGFKGAIDDLRVYDRALTDAEVAHLAGANPPPAGGGGDAALLAGCVGAPNGTNWLPTEGAIRLLIPAHQGDIHLTIMIAKGKEPMRATLAKAMRQPGPPADLSALTKGGPSRYPQVLTTKGQLGKPDGDSPYVVDTLTAPDDNPWSSWMRFGGFDFFEDGKRAAVCTWSGDVWIVSGIDDNLDELKWRRIATGMFQPLGVKIVNGDIYVGCRDQITKLVDLNGDGETDFYQNFNNDHQVTEHFHEFAMDLQTDKAGNFYYAKSARHARDSLVQQHGTLLRVSPDGQKTTILANGYRAANGVGVGPNGEFFTSDQEGHWMPANRINLVREGSFSGNMYSYHMGDKPKDYDRPIVWLPKQIDRSPAEQVWVTSDKWGLPRGSLLSLSYGTGYLQNVMYEMVEGLHPRVYVQGAFHRLVGPFPTGVMRGRFHKTDGQLYACGLFGWSSQRTRPGGFYRVRYTGKPLNTPVSFKVAADGIVLRFTDPLDQDSATDTENYLVQQWNYKWSGSYGSAEYKFNGRQKGREDIDIEAVHLSKDGRTVWVEILDLQPSMQLRLQMNIKSKAGARVAHDVYGSVHVVPDRDGAELLETK